MFRKLSKNSSVKNILVITLSNVGDVVLSAPVMDILLRDFPTAKMSVVVGERAASLFEGNPRITRIHLFDKNKNFIAQARWTLSLRKYRYDLVVDLRNSMIGYFLTPTWVTPPSLVIDKIVHLTTQHLNRLRTVYEYGSDQADKLTIAPSIKDTQLIDQWLKVFLQEEKDFVFIAPYAADSAKTWDSKEFAGLSQSIYKQYGLRLVMIGSPAQREEIESIVKQSGVPILNLAGHTTLIQIAALLKKAKVAIVHDSGPMHIASYFNKPIVALFGPTDPHYSSPWSSVFKVVRRNENCPRCSSLKKVHVLHNCMNGITQTDVLNAFGEVYAQVR